MVAGRTLAAFGLWLLASPLASALLLSKALPRAPPPSLLLGADGTPMKKGNAGGGGGADGDGLAGNADADATTAFLASAPKRGSAVSFDMPDDLADFDPTYDPLAAKRPPFDMAAASGRPQEAVWGAVGPEDAASVAPWAQHMLDSGVRRVLGLFTAEDASARATDGTPQGYFAALVDAGFEAGAVGLVDPRADGAREAILGLMRAAAEAREVLCIHCADGHALTSVPLADWLLTDYIGGDNYEEACHALASRKRLAGVERKPDPAMLQQWVEVGHL